MIDSNSLKTLTILPICNMEEYIGRCIESLQAQTTPKES